MHKIKEQLGVQYWNFGILRTSLILNSDSGFDSGSDSHNNSDSGLCCLYFSFEELVFETVVVVVVVVVESEEATDIVIDTEAVVETVLPSHMDKGDMA